MTLHIPIITPSETLFAVSSRASARKKNPRLARTHACSAAPTPAMANRKRETSNCSYLVDLFTRFSALILKLDFLFVFGISEPMGRSFLQAMTTTEEVAPPLRVVQMEGLVWFLFIS
jgi:hypothetical protein